MNRRLSLSLSVAAVALAFAGSLVIYLNRERWLPAQVPTHWNFRNEVDATTPRDNLLPVLLIMPAVMVGDLLLTLALPWLSPKPFSVESFRGTYNYIMLLAVLMCG